MLTTVATAIGRNTATLMMSPPHSKAELHRNRFVDLQGLIKELVYNPTPPVSSLGTPFVDSLVAASLVTLGLGPSSL